ncbi:MAG: TAT-variant-translocated molybdopterin oxidoreductase [Fimbriimonadaceae bacterium]|nr:TAT-variant-translocated molybdopterin oxidoreductase [Fimbriimonadaceae bacterium]
MDSDSKRNDLAALQAKLARAKGRDLWRGLEEISDTPEFQRWVDDEFPYRATIPQVDRRGFLKFMGASMLLAGLSGCRYLPKEYIVPHVTNPEDRVTGQSVYYASTVVLGGYGTGVLVRSYEGRPLKIEGNPGHPSSLGSTDATIQALMHTMYDPDRSKNVTHGGEIATWDAALTMLRDRVAKHKSGELKGDLRLLTETVTSPTLAFHIRKLLAHCPGAVWHQYDAVSRDAAFRASATAFHSPAETVYDFTKADIVFSLDADFFSEGPGHVRYTRDFMARRKVEGDAANVNRLYAVESTPNLVGAFADVKVRCKASEVVSVALAVASRLGLNLGSANLPATVSPKFVDAVVADLQKNRGRAIVIPGEHQSEDVHAIAHAINAALGNIAVSYLAPVAAEWTDTETSVKSLAMDMASGRVETLLILGGNPVYNAPADLAFGEALAKVPVKVRMGLYEDETSALCDWHLPEAYWLEAWGDARAHDGTASIVQPLIEPLYEGKSHLEVVAGLTDKPHTGLELLKEYWKGNGLGSDAAWNKALHDGVIPNSTSPEVAATIVPFSVAAPQAPASIEVIFRPDPTIGDGSLANNGWLQELPKPLTKTTWENCAYLSPKTAEALNLNVWRDADNPKHDVVEVKLHGASVKVAAMIQPGHPDDSVTLHLGYGRTKAGKIGNGLGGDAYALRKVGGANWSGGATIERVGSTTLGNTQYHHSMEGRDLIRYGTVAQFAENPTLSPEPEQHAEEGEGKEPNLNLYKNAAKEHEWDGHQWAMAIDLNLCIGCNACTAACNAENNIPVVGKDQVSNGREMHWIRVDRYYGPREGDQNLEDPVTHFQPVTCMHCEYAPCEPVCPVAATVHSREGLNQMVYNRCVGTRYCSNNCPYKVRRFNWFNFANHHDVPVIKLRNNPDVTVRGRGVMEKCTYCVQRINVARIAEKKSGVPMKDGAIVTACQQACPAQAIVFGDKNDPGSAISRLRAEKRNYSLLGELNTAPRTTYLAKVKNPNPELEKA